MKLYQTLLGKSLFLRAFFCNFSIALINLNYNYLCFHIPHDSISSLRADALFPYVSEVPVTEMERPWMSADTS